MMIEEYDSLNVDEAYSVVARENAAFIDGFIAYERDNKNRKTLIERLEPLVTTVESPRSGYIGGHWFDESGERKTVKIDSRVSRAIENGELKVI